MFKSVCNSFDRPFDFKVRSCDHSFFNSSIWLARRLGSIVPWANRHLEAFTWRLNRDCGSCIILVRLHFWKQAERGGKAMQYCFLAVRAVLCSLVIMQTRAHTSTTYLISLTPSHSSPLPIPPTLYLPPLPPLPSRRLNRQSALAPKYPR